MCTSASQGFRYKVLCERCTHTHTHTHTRIIYWDEHTHSHRSFIEMCTHTHTHAHSHTDPLLRDHSDIWEPSSTSLLLIFPQNKQKHQPHLRGHPGFFDILEEPWVKLKLVKDQPHLLMERPPRLLWHFGIGGALGEAKSKTNKRPALPSHWETTPALEEP